jgi:hypothetical protein
VFWSKTILNFVQGCRIVESLYIERSRHDDTKGKVTISMQYTLLQITYSVAVLFLARE